MQTKNGRIHYWLWFGLILTSLPLILTYWKLRGIAVPTTSWIDTFKEVVSRGELLLVCLSLLGVNLGDLFREKCNDETTGFTLLAATFILCLFAIYSFGEINTNGNLDKSYALNTSLVVFLCCICVCLISLFTPRKTA
nr:hypothetical protein [uncultured Sediminibacterium sp.]